MEKVLIDQLQPEMILARSILLADGRIWIRQKTEITSSIITKLKELRLSSIYVETPMMEDLVNEPVCVATRSDLIQSLFKVDSELRLGKGINLAGLKKQLYAMVDEVVGNYKNSQIINEIRVVNDYIFGHSVNVSVIAVKIGLHMGYNQLKLSELALGAIFHDIGMTKVSAEILGRIGGLSREELKEIESHPKVGYDLLKQCPDFSAVSAHIAYQHHERYNGSGYPRKMSGTDIHEYARITAIADVFDAMTTEKIYRHAKSVPETLKYIKDQKGIEFDPAIVAVLDKALTYETIDSKQQAG